MPETCAGPVRYPAHITCDGIVRANGAPMQLALNILIFVLLVLIIDDVVVIARMLRRRR
ncbi:MAG: hypothetical protein WKF57_06200 [Nakamurella sp.]